MRNFLEQISFLVIILGVPAFFYEQHNDRLRQAKATTLEYVNRFHGAELTKQRFAVLAPWLDRDLNMLRKAGASQETLNDLSLADIDASVAKGAEHDMRSAVFDLVDFYDSLSVCLETDLCSKELAQSYFGDYAPRFFCLYKGYINKVRRGQSIANFGARLEAFSKSIKPC